MITTKIMSFVYTAQQRSLKLTFLFLTLISVTSCGLIDRIFTEVENTTDKTIAILDDAIDAISQNSGDWQIIVEKALSDLPADLQSTIRTEMTTLVEKAVATTGTELRCNADFVPTRVKQGLTRIKTKLLGGTLPPLEPKFCQVIPSGVDMELASNRRNKLEFYGYDFDVNTSLKVLLKSRNGTKDVTHALNRLTHYHMILNLSSNGVKLNESSERIILQWNNQEISSIPVLQKEIAICKAKFVNTSETEISFVPKHTRGDREFDGNGPKIQASVQLFVQANRLKARVSMNARETRSDWTTASETRTFTLYSPDSGWRIHRVITPTSSSFSYIDNDHANDTYAGSGPVKRYVFMGDGSGNDAGVHTSIKVAFNRIRLELKQSSDCVPPSTIQEMIDIGAITPNRQATLRSKPNFQQKKLNLNKEQ